MPAGKDWHRRLPAALHLATVINRSKDAGSYDEQPMSAHRAAWLAARVARLSRVQKAVAIEGLAKYMPVDMRGRAAANLVRAAWGGMKAFRGLGGQIGAEIGGKIGAKSAARRGLAGIPVAASAMTGRRRGAAIGKDVATLAMAGYAGYGAGVLRNSFNAGGGIDTAKRNAKKAWRDTKAVFSGEAFTVAGNQRLNRRDREDRKRPEAAAKATPATARDWFGPPELRKALPLMAAANIASMVIPAVASSNWGKRAISWGTRKLLGPAVRATSRAVQSGIPGRGVRYATAAGPTQSGMAGFAVKNGRSAFGKFRRNPGRAVLGLNRHLYNNRGSYMLAAGGAMGGYEADQAWREASPKRRMMGDV